MKKSASLLTFLLFLSATAQAQGLDQATRKGIDAHAFAFSGRHCSGGIEVDPGDKMTSSQFRILALLMEEGLKEAAKVPTVKYKSEFNEKDLYRTVITNRGETRFVMLFLSGSKTFGYKCDLK